MEAYYDQCGYDAERKEKERKTRIRKLWYKAYRGVLIQKKVQRMFKGEQIDPTIERIMMSQMHKDDEPTTSSSSSKAETSSSKSDKAKPKKSPYFKKGKLLIP